VFSGEWLMSTLARYTVVVVPVKDVKGPAFARITITWSDRVFPTHHVVVQAG
jgi:hypothetical protein